MGKKSIIYDGGCTLCIRSKNSLLRLGLADKDYTWAYQEMPDEYLAAVDYERFRSEMALIDLDGGETLYGPDAVVHLLSSKLWIFKWLFSIGFIYRIL
ncbi:MAG: DCC1-like thiol-disulfide oxidoreductase family protein [Bacteroidota bacterium]